MKRSSSYTDAGYATCSTRTARRLRDDGRRPAATRPRRHRRVDESVRHELLDRSLPDDRQRRSAGSGRAARSNSRRRAGRRRTTPASSARSLPLRPQHALARDHVEHLVGVVPHAVLQRLAHLHDGRRRHRRLPDVRLLERVAAADQVALDPVGQGQQSRRTRWDRARRARGRRSGAGTGAGSGSAGFGLGVSRVSATSTSVGGARLDRDLALERDERRRPGIAGGNCPGGAPAAAAFRPAPSSPHGSPGRSTMTRTSGTARPGLVGDHDHRGRAAPAAGAGVAARGGAAWGFGATAAPAGGGSVCAGGDTVLRAGGGCGQRGEQRGGDDGRHGRSHHGGLR